MKLKIPSLVRLALVVTLVLTCIPVVAGTAILGAAGKLVVDVPPGQVLVIRAFPLVNKAGFCNVSINIGGSTFSSSGDYLGTRYQPRYLAGPCTVTFTSNPVSPSDYALLSYDVVPANGIQTLVATTGSFIQVPSGKRLRLLDGSYPLYLAATLTNGDSASFVLSPNPTSFSGLACNTEGFELAGPLTVTVNGIPATDFHFVTYFFASDVIPSIGESIQAPVGSLIAVEKSTDLKTWFPAYQTTEKTAPKAFYRLNVVR